MNGVVGPKERTGARLVCAFVVLLMLLAVTMLCAPGCVMQWGSDVHQAQQRLFEASGTTVDLLVAQGRAFQGIAEDRERLAAEAMDRYDDLALQLDLASMTDANGNVQAPATQVKKMVENRLERAKTLSEARYAFKAIVDAHGKALDQIERKNDVSQMTGKELQAAMEGAAEAGRTALTALGSFASGLGLSFAW